MSDEHSYMPIMSYSDESKVENALTDILGYCNKYENPKEYYLQQLENEINNFLSSKWDFSIKNNIQIFLYHERNYNKLPKKNNIFDVKCMHLLEIFSRYPIKDEDIIFTLIKSKRIEIIQYMLLRNVFNFWKVHFTEKYLTKIIELKSYFEKYKILYEEFLISLIPISNIKYIHLKLACKLQLYKFAHKYVDNLEKESNVKN